MDSKFDYTETIENYIRGEMSGDQKLQFENQLNQDPLLKEEFLMQQDMIHSIQNVRRAELKSRLDGVQIGLFDGVTSTAGFKILTATMITAVVGIGSYYAFFNKSEQPLDEVRTEEQVSEMISESGTTPVLIDTLKDTSNDKKTSQDGEKSEEKTEVEENAPELIAQADQPSTTTETNPQAETKKEEAKEEVVDFNPVIPDLNDNFAEEDSTPDNDIAVPDNELGPSKTETRGDFEIEISEARNRFHYRFKSGKLILYGDFSGSTYEIIELNSTAGKSYYLFFDNNFYPLNVENTKATELRVLTDKTLIEELKKIKGDN